MQFEKELIYLFYNIFIIIIIIYYYFQYWK